MNKPSEAEMFIDRVKSATGITEVLDVAIHAMADSLERLETRIETLERLTPNRE